MVAVMGANTPAAGEKQEPSVKHKGRPTYHEGRNNVNRNNNYDTRKILGADLNLCWKAVWAKRNRSEQVANFKTINNLIKAQLGTECNPFVLESLEKDTIAGLPEPVPVYMVKIADTDPDVMTRAEKMKFKSKFDKYLNRNEKKIKMQLRQVFSKYDGQVNEDVRVTLNRRPVKVSYMKPLYFKRFLSNGCNVHTVQW